MHSGNDMNGMFRILLILISVLHLPIVLHGQTTEAASADATLLMREYFKPMIKGSGMAMSRGWLNTAEVNKPFQFQFLVTPMVLNVSSEDLLYRTDDLGLEHTIQTNGNTAPTFFGPSGEANRPTYEFTDPGNGEITQFTGPEGVDLIQQSEDFIGISKPLFPFPVLNFAVSLPLNSSVALRWFPKVKISEDTDVQLWGIGINHELSSYFFREESVPVNISIFAGYSSLKFDTDLRTDDITVDNEVVTTDGRGTVRVHSLTFQSVLSKDVGWFTFFGGPGVVMVVSNSEISGRFNYRSGDEIKEVVDPINYSLNSSSMQFALGAKVKLAFVTLHTAFTFQEYNTLEFGLGFEF
jgi:hypothetical protein